MRIFVNLIFVFLFSSYVVSQDINIIPQPAHLIKKEGNFVITKNTSLVVASDEDIKTAEFLNSYLERFYGFELPVKKQADKNSIQIITKLNNAGKDAYS